MKTMLLASSALLGLACPSIASAQAAPPTTIGDQTSGAIADAGRPDSETSFSVGEEIVVTGPSLARQLAEVITSIDLLGGDLLQRQSVDNSWELFARLPGVVLTDFGQGTTSGRFSVRGFNGEGEINAVKLLIDGIPANANDGGMVFIDDVMPLDISGIELVRGTSDPRYGLNGIAGNANILTRVGGTYVDTRLLGGAFGTYEGQVSAGLDRGGIRQNYFVGYRRSDSYRQHAELERLSLAGKWFTEVGPLTLGAIARYATLDAQEPGYLTDADAYTHRRLSYAISETDGGKRRLGQYSVHADADLADGVKLSVKGYANDLHDDRFVRFSASVSQQRRLTDERQYGGLFAIRYHPRPSFLHDLRLEAGGDVQVQDNQSRRWSTDRRALVSKTRDQDFGLTVYGGYLQAVIEPTDWLKITPGWRLDRVGGDFTNRLNKQSFAINDYGTISQPKLSIAVTPSQGWAAYANYGRTFQVGVGAGAYKVPPRAENLEPSINEGWEAGVRYAPNRRLEARVALWQQTASGEIKRRLNDPSGDFDNLGETRRRGIDVQIDVKPASWMTVWGAYSYQHARIVTPDPATPAQAGNRIDHVPQNVLSGGVEVTPATRWRLSLTGNGQSSYELAPSNAQERYGDYFVLNGELAFAVTPRLELSAQVKNLANDRYEYVWFDGTQVLHSPADPRSVYAALRVKL